MKYGCIGEHLPHSFSKEIHARLASNEYELCELTPQEVDAFMKRRDFCGINVTIPYKQTVIPYLDKIDAAAREIGAVNTVVNRGGRLCGYNTDFGGMRMLLKREGLDLSQKKVLILGTGGTSKTARAVAASMGAGEIFTVSRTAREGAIDYQTAYREHSDAEIIINTTPCGMYPNTEDAPLELARFPRLCGLADAIYNPLRSKLVLEAQKRGVKAFGGLYMLVAQAVLASSHFTGVPYGEETAEAVYREILVQKQNVVLVGMPGCGKSTVGAILAQRAGRRLLDTDEMITAQSGIAISEIFSRFGEAKFRTLESEAIAEAADMSGCVIATGGGAILREENVARLQRNGRIYFLDRPIEELIPTDDRPLASTEEAIRTRYAERYGLYCSRSDETVKTLGDPILTAEEIERRHQL